MNQLLAKAKKQLIWGIFGIMLLITLAPFMINPYSSTNVVYGTIALVSLVEILLFLVGNYLVFGTFLNFASLFVACLYLFHYGQVLLVASRQSQNLTIVLKYFEDWEFFTAYRWINLALMSILFGILLAGLVKPKSDSFVQRKICFPMKVSDAKRLALWVIILTFPVKLYVEMSTLLVALFVDFETSTSWYASIRDFIVTYGNFSMTGFVLLLFVLRKESRKQTLLFMFIAAYTILAMVSGRRSEGVAYLCVCLYVYLCSKKNRLNFKRLWIYALAAYVFLAFLFSVVAMRNQEQLSFGSFLGIVRNTLTNNNPIFEALREYGNTGYTAVCALTRWLPVFGPVWGKSYIMGLTAIIPNVGGWVGEITNESVFGFALQAADIMPTQYRNIGGSIIGEVFYNFGSIGGVLVAILLGLMIGFISKRAQEHLNSDPAGSIIPVAASMTSVLYWVRSYFSNGIRDVVWSIAFCFVMYYIVRKYGEFITEKILNMRRRLHKK